VSALRGRSVQGRHFQEGDFWAIGYVQFLRVLFFV